MSEAEQLLTDLLDDPSFNRWIKGKATITIYTQQQSEEVKPEPLYSHVEVGYGEKANLKISDGSRIQEVRRLKTIMFCSRFLNLNSIGMKSWSKIRDIN